MFVLFIHSFFVSSLTQGQACDVRAAKVVAGLEPECTNTFLLALAEIAADPTVDSPEAVRMCLNGDEPGVVAPPKKGRGKAESKGESKSRERSDPDVKSGGGGGGAKGVSASSDGIPDAKSVPPPVEEDVPRERSQSRSGTRAGRPAQQSTESGLGGITKGGQLPNLDSDIEKCDGTEATTQAMLGAIITRPKLSDKLLGKPPFRFLFDIVMEVVKVTGFAEGLYSPEEMDPNNNTEKNQKLSFLEKIVKLVGVQLNTMVAAKPTRIIGGYDPQDTNNFLQLLAVAARLAPDSRDAVRSVLDLGGNDFAGRPAGGSSAPPVAAAPVARAEDKHPPATVSSPVAQAKNNQNKPTTEDRRELVSEDRTTPADDDGGDEVKRSTRPTTARRRPPKVKDGAKEVTARDTGPVGKKTQGIIVDGQDDDDDEEVAPEEKRLADEVKADAKGTAAAPAQSKLVQDILGRQAEQEAARKSGASVPTEIAADETKGNEDNGGGIRLGRLRKTGTDKGKNTQEHHGPGAFNDGDMERLRGAIQVLVQHTGPLGTCMDYVQEDISLMTAELQRWEEECRRYEVEVENEKRKSREILQPLQVELAEIDEQLLEQQARISSTKAAIARNDERIQQILKIVATS